MKRLPAALALALVVLCSAGTAHAWFEQRLAGSRQFAMGGATAANVFDITALFWNPAGLAGLTQPQLVLDYAQPYVARDLAENAAAFGTRWRDTGIAAGWHWLGIPGTYGELAATLAAGRVLARGADGHVLSGGAAVQYLRAGFDPFTVAGTGEHVDYGSRSAATVHLAATWQTPWLVDVAWVGRDVFSPTIRFVDDTPGGRLDFTNELAVAFRWNRESTITGSLLYEPRGATAVAVGGEIWFYDVVALRSGFNNLSKITDAGASPNDFQYTGGIGVRHRGWEVAASAFTHHELGVSYRASLLKSFGTGGRP